MLPFGSITSSARFGLGSRRLLLCLLLTTPAACGASEQDAGPPAQGSFRQVEGAFDQEYWSGLLATDGSVGNGAAVGDVDGDGRPDLVLARIADSVAGVPGGDPSLLINLGAATTRFREDPNFGQVAAGKNALGVALADYDADGDLDIFLACAGPDLLLQNRGAEGFVNVAAAVGVDGPSGDTTTGGLWADLNHDGWLDLYVSQFIIAPPQTFDAEAIAPESRNRLYLNQGDGTFSDASEASGADSPGATHTTMAVDANGDGNLDLFLANDSFSVDGEILPYRDGGPVLLPQDALLVNVGFDVANRPLFVDRAGDMGLLANRSSMGIATKDLNDDDLPDFYVTDWGQNELYLSTGPEEPYRQVAEKQGVASAPGDVGWSARFFDGDADGRLELLVVNGTKPQNLLLVGASEDQRSMLFEWDQGSQSFVEQAESEAFAFSDAAGWVRFHGTRLAAFGDFNGDHSDDFVLAGAATPPALFEAAPRNPGADVLRLSLEGTVSAIDPVGAIVRAHCGSQRLSVVRSQGGEPYGHSDAVIELVCPSASLSDVVIDWPSGFSQTLADRDRPTLEEVKVKEPSWLEVSQPNASDQVRLTYRALAANGDALGPLGAGRGVEFLRSDALPLTVTDHGDGTYSATIEGVSGEATVSVSVVVDGVQLAARPTFR